MPKYVVEGLDDAKPAGVFEELTNGKYLVRIGDHEVAENKKGNPQAVTKVEIISSPNSAFDGRNFIDFNVLTSDYGKSKLRALLDACGVKITNGSYEASKLFGKQVIMVIQQSKPTEAYPEPKAQVSTWQEAKIDEDGVPASPAKKSKKGAMSFD